MEGQWFGELRGLLHEAPSARGWRRLCELCEAPEAAGVDEWLPYAQDLLDRGWPAELRVAPAAWLQAVVDGALPRGWPLVRIALLRGVREDAKLDRLIEAEALAGLEVMALSAPSSAALMVRALQQPRKLVGLSLYGVRLDEALAAALIEPPGLPALVSLELTGRASEGSPAEGAGLAQLLTSGACARLMALYAERLKLDGSLAGALRGLRSGCAPLAVSLADCEVTDQDVSALIESGALASVERLELGRNKLGDDAARALAQASLPALRELSLEDNRIGDAGAQTLASAQWVGGLEVLELDFNVFGAEGRRALYESEGLAPGLRAAFGASGGMGFGI